MNHLPKNTTILTPEGKAELFFQTTNCDHFTDNYRQDGQARTNKERVHDVRFRDVASLLSGNVYLTRVKGSQTKWQAISLFNGKYYVTFLHLATRPDCRQLFAVLITTYITYDAAHKSQYQAHLQSIRERFGPR